MMDAEMYGITPSAKIDQRRRAPPENMLNMLRIVPDCCSKKRDRATGSMPGTGTNVPSRYTINAPIKKNRRWRRSAKRVASPSSRAGLTVPAAFAIPWLLQNLAAGRFDDLAGAGRDLDAAH